MMNTMGQMMLLSLLLGWMSAEWTVACRLRLPPTIQMHALMVFRYQNGGNRGWSEICMIFPVIVVNHRLHDLQTWKYDENKGCFLPDIDVCLRLSTTTQKVHVEQDYVSLRLFHVLYSCFQFPSVPIFSVSYPSLDLSPYLMWWIEMIGAACWVVIMVTGALVLRRSKTAILSKRERK